MKEEEERKKKQKTKTERRSKRNDNQWCPEKGKQPGIREAFRMQKGIGKKEGIG